MTLPHVRHATIADERALYDLLVDMWRGNARGWGFDYDPAIVIGRIQEGTRPNPQDRSDPSSQRRGIIGVIEQDDRLVASIGIFLDAPLWFVNPKRQVAPTELWFYIRPAYRGRRYERLLRDYALDVRDKLREGVEGPMPLVSGFMHQGQDYSRMQALWQRLWPRARQVGSLFWID
jgi:GNAT superfamily N-acetyltransferase